MLQLNFDFEEIWLFEIDYLQFLCFRVPKEKEDVITIPDEPSSKKARIEDTTDNISVSSESVQSIEVNDISDVEESSVPDVEIVIEKVLEKQPQDEIGKDVPEIILDDFESENVKVVNEKADELQIQEEIIIEENLTKTVTQTKNKIQGYEIDSTEGINIYEANTQIPLNISSDTMDGEERSFSMKVTYDLPNAGNETVPVLRKLEDDNLPSTNDTDDVQITCGQVVNNSEEVEGRKCVDEKDGTSKVNGTNLPEKGFSNGDIPEGNKEINIKVPMDNDLTVEDMLADFVDEIKEDTQVT